MLLMVCTIAFNVAHTPQNTFNGTFYFIEIVLWCLIAS